MRRLLTAAATPRLYLTLVLTARFTFTERQVDQINDVDAAWKAVPRAPLPQGHLCFLGLMLI